jgi:hypothetical protein
MIPRLKNAGTKMQPVDIVPMFQPTKMQGFQSYPEPSSLPPQLFSLINNGRLSKGVITVRDGDPTSTNYIDSLTSSYHVRGVYESLFNGVQTIFVAIGDGSTRVNIYKSTDEGATWSNISPSSGMFGDTRLSGSSTSGPVYFQVVKDNAYGGTSYDVVVIQNGTDTPRIYAQGVMSIQNQPQAITNTSAIQQRWGFANFFPIEFYFYQTFSNTGATPIVLSNPAGAYINLNVPSGASTNSTATVAWSGALDFSKSTQFVMITDQFKSFAVSSYASTTGVITFPANSFNSFGLVGLTCDVISGTGAGQSFTVQSNTATTITPANIPSTILDNTSVVRVPISPDPQLLYQNLKVAFTDNVGVTATIFDPSAQIGSIVATTYPSNVSLTGLQVGYALPTGGTIDYAHITKIVFTYLPSAAIPTNLQIYVMAAGGETQGGARFGLAYHSSYPRGTGPGLVITNTQAAPMGDIGAGNGMTNLTLLENQAFYYDYEVRAVVPNSANVANGVDTLLIFRQDVGQSGYYYCQQAPVATYSAGTWTADPSNPLVIGRQISDHYDLSGLVNFAQPLPSGAALTTPIGTAMDFINGRFLICGGATLWISDYQQPFLFTLAQRFLSPGVPDELSGTTQTRPGETFQQISALGAIPATSGVSNSPLSGTSTVYIWTDSNFYQLPGFSPTGLNTLSFVASHGTNSPYSVARLRTALYWLDNQNEICTFSAGMSMLYGTNVPDMQTHVLSLYRVDDQTLGIPQNRLAWVSGAVRNNRYYLAYSAPSASTNQQALVWSDQQGFWESIDTFGGTVANSQTECAFMMPYVTGTSGSGAGYQKLYYFGTDASGVYMAEHEVPGDTSNVSFNVTFRELNSAFTKLIEMDTVQVAASSAHGAFTLYTSRVIDGQTSTPSIGMMTWPAGVIATKTDMKVPGLPYYKQVGGTGNRILLSIYNTSGIPGGTTILSVSAKTKALEGSYHQ